MRGFASGVFWGLVVCGLGLAVLSVLSPPPADETETGMIGPGPQKGPQIQIGIAGHTPAPTHPGGALRQPALPAIRAEPAGNRGLAGVQPQPVSLLAPGEPEPRVPQIVRNAAVPTDSGSLPQAGTESGALRPGVGKRALPLTARDSAASARGPVVLPLEQFAIPFDTAPDRPLMAVVLVDGTVPADIEALRGVPFPLSIAIDPAMPDALARMALYRDAGLEVMSLVDLSPGATAQDAEVALSAGFATLNEAVAVLEGAGTGVQGNRDLSGQVADFVKSTGRGVVMQSNGLNSAYQQALRDHVPAALVFRDAGDAGEDGAALRRFLDRAALRAGQRGAVIVTGRLQPDSLRALAAWGQQNSGVRVALAPVSAVLLRSVVSR